MGRAASKGIDGHGSTKSLIDDAIRSIVAEAITNGGMLQVGPHARRLADNYPGSLSEGRIADEIILAASKAGVMALEMGRPERDAG
jgi:hypothetical protein